VVWFLAKDVCARAGNRFSVARFHSVTLIYPARDPRPGIAREGLGTIALTERGKWSKWNGGDLVGPHRAGLAGASMPFFHAETSPFPARHGFINR
jgi:hypothetical protein